MDQWKGERAIPGSTMAAASDLGDERRFRVFEPMIYIPLLDLVIYLVVIL